MEKQGVKLNTSNNFDKILNPVSTLGLFNGKEDTIVIAHKLYIHHSFSDNNEFKTFAYEIYTQEMIKDQLDILNHKTNHSPHIYTYLFTSTYALNGSCRSLDISDFHGVENEDTICCVISRKGKEKYKNKAHITGTLMYCGDSYYSVNSTEDVYLIPLDINLLASNKSKSITLSYNQFENALNEALKDFNNSESESPTSQPPVSDKALSTIYFYNVGNASTTKISHHSGVDLFFDCAIDNSASQKYVPIVNTISKEKPNVIIISHWHLDHYNLIANLIQDNDNLTHIYHRQPVGNYCIPNQIKFIFIQIQNKVKIKEVNKTNVQNHELSSLGINDIIMYVADDTKSNLSQSDYINDTCIMLSIGNNKIGNRIFLPADASYDCWPDDPALYANLNRFVLPHHGFLGFGDPNNSYLKKYNVKNLKFIRLFFSSSYPYPVDSHQKYLETAIQIPKNSPQYNGTRFSNGLPYRYTTIKR